jgi:hypothetical protein
LSSVTSSFNEIKIDGNNNQITIGSNKNFEPILEWLKKTIAIKVASAGKRYSPNIAEYKDLNQNLEISNLFNYFNNEYIINYLLQQINIINQNNKTTIDGYSSFDKFNKEASSLSEDIQNINILNYFSEKISSLKEELNKNKWLASMYLEDFQGTNSLPPYMARDVEIDITNMQTKFEAFEKLAKSLTSKKLLLHQKNILLISGEALIGKTHLFCDVAINQLKINRPTLLFFGNEFNNNGTILSNMINNLGIIKCSDDDFLINLDKLGKEHNTKTLIMIDAINETKDMSLWRNGLIEFCIKIKSYNNLALALSIRDVEKNKLISNDNEEYIFNEIVEVEHKGFEGIEMEAIQTFCKALGVDFPKVPIHTHRLFVNPGILFLYIEIIKNNIKKINTDIISPTVIFKTYLENLNRKFYQKYSDEVDEDDEVIQEAIKAFISIGSKDDYTHFYLNYKVVSKELKSLHNKVLEFLISEGVFNKIKTDDNTHLYFTYQKFENYFIVDYLLNDFEKNKETILNLIKNYNGAISEALLTQIPENLNKEVFDLNVWLVRDSYISQQYINSLIWRKVNAINDDTFKYINFVLPLHDLYNDYLDVVLQLSTIPNHPLNILRLHRRLLKFKLSERDYYWSIYIHNSFIDDGIVKKIIHWAWSKDEEFEIIDESLYLYGLTLSWFLTSSNRELRDSATKSLVNLFTNKIDVFLQVLIEFENINDLYILERLYAVGYGIVLRSFNHNGFKELSEYIYNTVFNQDQVIEHILLRDYARFTIEHINKIISLSFDLKKIHPPYNQNIQWELPKIDKSEVEKYRNDYRSIYSSSLSGDFKIYQVYSYANHFLNLKICDRPHEKLPQERYDDFFNGLNEKQTKAYDKTRLASHEVLKIMNTEVKDDSVLDELEDTDIDSNSIQELKKTKIEQSDFKSLLSPQQLKEYDEIVINYYDINKNQHNIDIKSIKRLIFLEAIKLGWKKELFEEFDNHTNSWDRHEHRTERIGKKYQWTALHTVLAKLLDNYEYQDGRSSHKISNYEGTYQISIRDIDPTTILNNKVKKENKYWFNINKDFENSQISDIEWMSSSYKLPNILDIINIKNNSIEYFLLNMNFSLDGNKNNTKYRNLYYAIDSFIVKKDDMNSIIEWMKKQNFYARKMPHSSHFHDTYLREYPNSNSYNYIDDYYYGQMTWDDSFDDVSSIIPAKVLLTSTGYFNEGRSYDLSVEEGIEVKLPNKWFIDEMRLKQSLNDGEWINEDKEIVFFDPTVESCCVSEYNENGVLVANMKLLLDFLDKNGYTIFWILWGEKQVRNTENSFGMNDDFLGISEISGYGYFDGSNFIEHKDVKFEN